MEFVHKSVLLQESVDWLVTDPAGVYVDCTMGGAGHTAAIANRLTPEGLVVGIDRDDDALIAAKKKLRTASCKVKIVKSNFKNLDAVLADLKLDKVDGIFFDLGVSSYQLDEPERGFSYMHDGPLDMRMDRQCRNTAADIVNCAEACELEKILREYGEERWAKRIAEFIVKRRQEKPLATTYELVSVIKAAIPKAARSDGHHPAKRTFQALRIAVNGELEMLGKAVEDAVSHLKHRGRIGIITFHSLEDRIVKQKLAELYKGCICPPHLPCVCGRVAQLKKPGSVLPQKAELEENPRARSARLRYAEKI